MSTLYNSLAKDTIAVVREFVWEEGKYHGDKDTAATTIVVFYALHWHVTLIQQ